MFVVLHKKDWLVQKWGYSKGDNCPQAGEQPKLFGTAEVCYAIPNWKTPAHGRTSPLQQTHSLRRIPNCQHFWNLVQRDTLVFCRIWSC